MAIIKVSCKKPRNGASFVIFLLAFLWCCARFPIAEYSKSCPAPSLGQIKWHLIGDALRLALPVGPLLIGQPIGTALALPKTTDVFLRLHRVTQGPMALIGHQPPERLGPADLAKAPHPCVHLRHEPLDRLLEPVPGVP